ncbi:hypothetical protein [Streptococcus merionis]|uniref:hypothetical protein n=1 Tax=Streptococcus merionis TaxID=400065 RepID=UPI0035181B72
MTDETQTVHLRDLRSLGKQGGATARLDDGIGLILKPNDAVKQARGYVDGVLRDVEFHLPYKNSYDRSRTIKKESRKRKAFHHDKETIIDNPCNINPHAL